MNIPSVRSEKKALSYLRRAVVVAENSPDAETKVGSVLISRKTGSVVSEGYNGFVRGGPDHRIPKTRPEKHDFVIHAEENLICNAARNGVTTDDCFIVQTHSPCIRCARLLYQAGITEVYYHVLYKTTKDMEVLKDLSFQIKKIEMTDKDFPVYYRMTIEPSL